MSGRIKNCLMFSWPVVLQTLMIANCILLQQRGWATWVFFWEAVDDIFTGFITKQSLTLCSLLSSLEMRTWDNFHRCRYIVWGRLLWNTSLAVLDLSDSNKALTMVFVTCVLTICHSLTMLSHIIPFQRRESCYTSFGAQTPWPLILMGKLVYFQEAIETLAIGDSVGVETKKRLLLVCGLKRPTAVLDPADYSCPWSDRLRRKTERHATADKNSKE